MKFNTQPGPGLLIGIPTLGRPVTLSWATTYKSLVPPINYNQNTVIIWGKAVDQARNEICQMALDQGHKYVFFLGDDVEPPMNTLKQLIYRMEQNPQIGVVGAVYCSKCDPAAPLVFRENGRGSYWDWKLGEFFEVTGLGMDATLIRVEALKRLQQPFFKTVDEDQFADGVNQADQWTEDLYFCKNILEQTDYTIYCDGSLLCKHWDVKTNRAYTLPHDSNPLKQIAKEKSKSAIDIGCGPIDRSNEFPDHNLVRVDIRDEVNPDYRCDVRDLPFDNASFDLVFSSHVLEHFSRAEFLPTLKEWIRVLKPRGELVLVLPNIHWALEKDNWDLHTNDALNVFYGAQSNDFDFHKNGLYPELMRSTLKQLRFKDIRIEIMQDYNMIVRATKYGNAPSKSRRRSK